MIDDRTMTRRAESPQVADTERGTHQPTSMQGLVAVSARRVRQLEAWTSTGRKRGWRCREIWECTGGPARKESRIGTAYGARLLRRAEKNVGTSPSGRLNAAGCPGQSTRLPRAA